MRVCDILELEGSFQVTENFVTVLSILFFNPIALLGTEFRDLEMASSLQTTSASYVIYKFIAICSHFRSVHGSVISSTL
jgi:hypothetical protein